MWASKKVSSSTLLHFLVVAAAVAGVVVVVPVLGLDSEGGNGEGVKGIMTCLDKMLPCQQYILAKKPLPETCCNMLAQMIDHESSCPCAIYQSDDILKTINLTREEALKIPVACGHRPPDLTRCEHVKVTSSSPPSATTTSASITPAPAAKAGDNVYIIRSRMATNFGTRPAMNTIIFFAVLLLSLVFVISPLL